MHSVKELRESFLHYFESKNHKRFRSSPLVPHNDPTLLFANAGMNQFKDYFTGVETPEQGRATSVQKCVRAGGKHNDLENVGFTKRHHTFFEMLGNFSFGDYFKKEAAEFAWEYITEVAKLPPENLWFSVFREDDEAYDIWTNHIKVPKERVVRMDESENFWAMGDTGPCGPCSEIYIDRGEAFGPKETIFDGGERFLEIWNLVFMQYEKLEDGTQKDLPKPSVDTGMGLERLASVLQNTESNYEIDGMQTIVDAFSKLLRTPYDRDQDTKIALRVLTDHIRSVSFLIADGVQPGNEGRNYVLRRILRRAIRYGKKLGCNQPFFHKGVSFLVKEMGEAYPELVQNQSAIEKMIKFEEERFFETLDSGLKLLEAEISKLGSKKILDGKVAFKLYDTFGFPLDLTEVILSERNFKLDQSSFDQALSEQRDRSRKSWKGSGSDGVAKVYQGLGDQIENFKFTGYENLSEEKAKVLAIVDPAKAELTDELKRPGEVELVISPCPFYAESGGQVGDRGLMSSASAEVEVIDCQNPSGNFHVVRGRLTKGELKKGDVLEARVDEDARMKTRINHTMTHVMHAALHKILGEHIKQAGSLVGPDYLRFDFSHFQSLTDEEIQKIEDFCNRRIRENPKISLSVKNLDEAIKEGAIAFFEEKYDDEVRVLKVGDFSMELCGGTHAESLAEAGLFKIVQESSVAAGVRRIVAYTGQAAFDYVQNEERLLKEISETLKTPKKELLSRVQKLLKERSDLQKKLKQKAAEPSKGLDEISHEIDGLQVIVDVVEVESAKELRPIASDLTNRIKSGVVLVGTAVDDKASVIVSVTKNISKQFNTTALVGIIGEALEGRGGGRDDFAQVGGSKTSALTKDSLLSLAKQHIQSIKLSA